MTATTTVRSVNPVTGETVGVFEVMSSDQIRSVVERAREVGEWWASRSWSQRERCLLNWAKWLIRHADELFDLMHAEHGKLRHEAVLELVPTLEQIRWAARHARTVLRRRAVQPGLVMANHRAAVEYRPHGVVGVIAPWNYPVFTAAGQMAAYALAAGNAVVLKPSEYTPAIGKYLVDSFSAANPDLPTGLLSMVTGFGETGAALCRAGVDKIAFTGSTATGKRVLAACADNLVPAVVECGGKDAMIVAEDADVAAAAKAAVWGGYSNSGQTCVGIEQIYVVDGVRDKFLTELSRRLEGIRAGTSDDAAYGPMTMPGQFDVVRSHVDDAVQRGAELLIGGPDSLRSPFVDPVVLVDPPDDSHAVREETFGPTLTVRTVADVDEALRLANGRGFGLGASVFSRHRGDDIAQRVRAGMVAVNCAMAFVGIPALPFGGVGQSGFGRTHGADGLREFSVSKSYARELFPMAAMDTVTLRPKAITIRLIRLLMRVRHGR